MEEPLKVNRVSWKDLSPAPASIPELFLSIGLTDQVASISTPASLSWGRRENWSSYIKMSAAGTVPPPLRGKSFHRPPTLKPPSRRCHEDFCRALTVGKEVGQSRSWWCTGGSCGSHDLPEAAASKETQNLPNVLTSSLFECHNSSISDTLATHSTSLASAQPPVLTGFISSASFCLGVVSVMYQRNNPKLSCR